MKQYPVLRQALPLAAGIAVLAASVSGIAGQSGTPPAKTTERGVMLMNRIGPSSSELYISNSDGSAERKLFPASSFDLHASYSPDGAWIVFTSERNGLGQADIYRAHPDGTGVEQLTDSPALDDQGALSPDGTRLAFVSTRETRTANIWILDLPTRKLRNLTGQPGVQGDPAKPDGFFRPAWSPDGQWIAFSSDRNTEWRGHSSGAGWEHVQELGIYVVRPDGTGLRRLTQGGPCTGAPKWSADGTRVVFYEIPVEQTWAAHWPNLDAGTTSQIVSIDVTSGDRTEHTAGPGLKVMPQFLPGGTIGYLAKAGPAQGLAYTGSAPAVAGDMRSPAWSPDGSHVVYERVAFRPRPQNLPLYSWDPLHEYRYTDVFPSFSKDGKLLLTRKDGDSSLDIMDTDGSNRQEVFASKGGAAFSPSWSPDGQSIVFGYGGFLQLRSRQTAKIMMVKRDGTDVTALTDGTPNAGFPSWSPDGTHIVYRVWGEGVQGLRILNLPDRSVRVLTTDYDNLPYWSPDGQRIVFTRRHSGFNFDIFTIRPDGTDVRQLTTSPANDAHAVWTDDGRQIMWNSGMYGWKEEAALYDKTFQPYGQIFIMEADGSGKRQLTDSLWEDSMPRFVPMAGEGMATLSTSAASQDRGALDATVQAFLDRHRGTWHDLNVPESDGRVLHDLIVTHKFTRALEIGTSTGHSGIWIAWALAKTGGRLTTVEVDPGRHRIAVANFKEAGLAPYIDARLGDAHEIVPALSGPFDFVFSDADKDWYKNYLVAVWPKLLPGGCFTAHNISGRGAGAGIDEFLAHLKTLPDAVTTIDNTSRAGISISCKR